MGFKPKSPQAKTNHAFSHGCQNEVGQYSASSVKLEDRVHECMRTSKVPGI